MVLTRLPLLAGPTDGERFSGRRAKSGRDTEMSEYQKGCLTELKTHISTD